MVGPAGLLTANSSIWLKPREGTRMRWLPLAALVWGRCRAALARVKLHVKKRQSPPHLCAKPTSPWKKKASRCAHKPNPWSERSTVAGWPATERSEPVDLDRRRCRSPPNAWRSLRRRSSRSGEMLTPRGYSRGSARSGRRTKTFAPPSRAVVIDVAGGRRGTRRHDTSPETFRSKPDLVAVLDKEKFPSTPSPALNRPSFRQALRRPIPPPDLARPD